MLEETKEKRLIIGTTLLIVAFILEKLIGHHTPLIILMFIGAWLISGLDIIYQAFFNLKNKMLLAEHFLMSVATIGAIIIGEYDEAAMVMVLFQLGEMLEDRAVNKSRQSIADLMNIQTPIAYRLINDEIEEIESDEIKIGDLIQVRVGDKIPVDGLIVQGKSSLDMKALTGESMPVGVFHGDEVLSGSINLDSALIIEAKKSVIDSTANKIVELLEEATENQAKTESLITKFAKIYTPIVVAFALAIALIPPIFWGQDFFEWLRRGLIFLVVSCPCAFVVSVPMAFVTGLGVSSKLGILIKGGNVIENLSDIKFIASDKTGTLTQGNFEITEIQTRAGVDQEKLLAIAAGMEIGFTHPIAKAILNLAKEKSVKLEDLIEVKNIPGRGVEAKHQNSGLILGSSTLLKENGVSIPEINTSGTLVYLGQVYPEKAYLGHFIIKDEIKQNAKESINKLRAKGVEKIVMLTGDSKEIAEVVASELDLDDFKYKMLPQDKLGYVINSQDDIAFIGDGLNDAPVLAASKVGIAMGGIGSDASIEAADVVIINDDLSLVGDALDICKYTFAIAKQNIILSLGIKLIFLILSAFGMTAMWMAVFADVGVTLLAIANTFRIYLFYNKLKRNK